MAEENDVQETQEAQDAPEQQAEAATATADPRFEDFLKQIDEMTVRDLVGLVEAIEERYNVSASAAMAVAAAPAADGGGGEGEAAGGPSTVTVTLKSAGQQKVQVIKKVKEITGKGLKESKELVDGAPSPIKEGISPDEADSLKAQLEEVGAEVEIG